MGKKIIIFTNEAGVGMATALKEQITSVLGDSLVLVMDEMDLRSRAIGDFAEKVFNVKMNFVKTRAEIAEKLYARFSENSPRNGEEFKPNATSYRAMHRIIEKFLPDVVVTIGYGAINEAVGTRNVTSLNYKVVTLVDDYALHKCLVSPYVDGYIVCTENVRNVLIAYGIDGGKIHLADIPVERKYLTAKPVAISDRVKLDPEKPTLLYLPSGIADNFEGTLDVVKGNGKFNLLVYVGEDRDAFRTSVERGLYTFNEGTSLATLIASADAVLIPPVTYVAEVAFRLNKPIFLLQSEDAMHKRNATYLRPYTIDAETPSSLNAMLDKYANKAIVLKRKQPISDTDAGCLVVQIAK